MSRTRRSSQRHHRSTPAHKPVPQLPPQSLQNRFPLAPALDEQQLEAVHDYSMRLLETLGIEVMSARARDYFRQAGAQVDESSQIVKLDRDWLLDTISTAPATFTLTPRNPERAITIGGNHINFGLVSGTPNLHDRVQGRRAGNMADYIKLTRLGQAINVLHFFGNQATAPIDLPPNNRHLDTYKVNLVESDKPFMAVSIGPGRVKDAVMMQAIARGLSLEQLIDSPSAITNINVNSPRKLDDTMADALIQMAELGQATVVTPFTLMGAMTPATLAAALAQQNAEALLGVALTQLVRPGAPVVYGGFTSNVDMRSGAPAFGTPENGLANIAGGQLAKRYQLPYRTSACNASNTADAQAVYETHLSLWGALQGHGNLIYHAAGWLEGGLVASFEKLILDAEMLQGVSKMLSPLQFDPDDFGLDAMEEVGPGGHFFGCAHTMSRYKDAFYQPILSDWQNQENWQQAGAKDATERATAVWQQLLADFEAPPIDPSVVEALDAYIAQRKQAIGSGEP